MAKREFIVTKGKGWGQWCAGVARQNEKLMYYFPVARGHWDYSYEYEISGEHLQVLQEDKYRFYLLYCVMNDTHLSEPFPTPSMRQEIFDNILLSDTVALSEFMTDGRLSELGLRSNVSEFTDQFL